MALSCVNISSREFKNALKKYNLSSGTLAGIVSIYQNSKEGEGKFPPSSYIERQLSPVFHGNNDEVDFYAKRKDLVDNVYDKYTDAIEQKNTLLQYFKPENIRIFQKGDGKWEVKTARPVPSIKYAEESMKALEGRMNTALKETLTEDNLRKTEKAFYLKYDYPIKITNDNGKIIINKVENKNTSLIDSANITSDTMKSDRISQISKVIDNIRKSIGRINRKIEKDKNNKEQYIADKIALEKEKGKLKGLREGSVIIDTDKTGKRIVLKKNINNFITTDEQKVSSIEALSSMYNKVIENASNSTGNESSEYKAVANKYKGMIGEIISGKSLVNYNEKTDSFELVSQKERKENERLFKVLNNSLNNQIAVEQSKLAFYNEKAKKSSLKEEELDKVDEISDRIDNLTDLRNNLFSGIKNQSLKALIGNNVLTLYDNNNTPIFKSREAAEEIRNNGKTNIKGNFLNKIISGGQTGMDQIGLSVAKQSGIKTGGIMARGWITENGTAKNLEKEYGMSEDQRVNDKAKNADRYKSRTMQNAENADGTVYFTPDETKSKGIHATMKGAMMGRKTGTMLVINSQDAENIDGASDKLVEFIKDHNIKVLNVAGSRMSAFSDNPELADTFSKILKAAIDKLSYDKTVHGENLTTPFFTVNATDDESGTFNSVITLGHDKLYDNATNEEKTDQLISLISNGSIPISSLLIPAGLDRKSLNVLNSMEKQGIYRTANGNYTVGLKETELRELNQYDNLVHSNLFTNSELREIAKDAIFKLSEGITLLQNEKEANKALLGNAFEYEDFTKMSRIDILNTVGLKGLFNNLVKERYFNSLKNPYADEDDEFCDKMNAIYDNFDAFIQLGYDTLINLEGISTTENFTTNNENNGIDAETGLLSDKTNQEIEEIYGSSAENWQVGFRQVSAFTSLSKIVKNQLGELYDLNPDTTMKINGFGIGKLVDASEATAKILNYTQGAESLDSKDKDGNYLPTSMIAMLQKHIDEEPWLQQLVGEYYMGGDTDNEKLQGALLTNNNEQLKSQFYSNFQKYFQKYSVIYKTKNGDSRIKVINQNTYIESALKELSLHIAGKKMGNLTIWNSKTNSLDATKINRLSEIEKNLTPKNNRGNIELYDSNTVKQIKEVYDILDIKSPAESAFDWLFNPSTDETQYKKFLQSLHYINVQLPKVAEKQKDAFNPLSDSSMRGNYNNLISLISGAMGDSTESVTYQEGKMYYSYVNPGYLGTLISKLGGHTSNYEQFINDNYGRYEGWFFNSTYPKSEGRKQAGPFGWLNYWIDRLHNDNKTRSMLQHVVMLSNSGIGYKDMTPAQYEQSMYNMYNYDVHKNYAYYRVPVMSNKPSGEFVKFERFSVDYKNKITKELAERTFWQEINRIRAVNYRNSHIENKELLIKNFDKNGSKFQFLDFLNDYTGKGDFGNILQKIINNKGLDAERVYDTDVYGNKYKEPIKGEATYFNDNITKVIENELNKKFEDYLDYLKNENIIKYSINTDTGGLQIDDAGIMPVYGTDELEEFFWNDYFASLNMLQLTIGDIAYYKNSEDLQKRLAELHASGLKGNINATINGKRVTDGILRTVYLKDDEVKSDVSSNIRVAFDRILNNPKYNTPEMKAFVKAKLDNYLKVFDNVNVADAQGYSSPTSYRKKMAVFGNWTTTAEEMYKRLLSGNFDMKDLDASMQVIKPFVYSQVSQDGHNPYIPVMKMGVQNKNSEFTLIMADALMRGQKIDNKLSALYDIMEESQGLKKDENGNWTGEPTGKGIDTIQFESTVKAGLTGVIDINNLDNPNIIRTFREKVYNPDGSYNNDYLHEIPFDDYSVQQNIPEHLKGFQQMGSQQRVLSVGNMSNTDSLGNINYVNINEEDSKGNRITRTVSVEDAKKQYFRNVADNIKSSADDITKRFQLSNTSSTMRNIALSRMLRQEILKDARYGIDMLWACSVNKNGKFNIPLSDPIQAGRIQQLLNSIIKNNIDKQQIAGGPVVQVSNFGGSEDLQIRFQNKEGKILLSEKEFNRMKDNPEYEPDDYADKYVQVDKEYENYDDYVKDNQDSVAYYECYMTPYDDNLYNDFPDGNGGINIKAMEKENPRLFEFISYRIPTEGKYSMVPGKIVGFLPKECGEGVMYPKEITALSGSDFDIDKDYIMHYNLHRINYRDKTSFINDINEQTGISKSHIRSVIENKIPEGESMLSDNRILNTWNNYEKGLVTYRSWTDGRFKRDNDMIATQWAMITSKQATDQLFTPGNFDDPKKLGYLIATLNTEKTNSPDDLLAAYNELSKKSIDDLKDLSYKGSSLLYNNVQLKFHKQNMVAGKLIGVFAQANTSHVIVGFAKNPLISINNNRAFRLEGHDIKGNTRVDNEYSFDNITRESEVLAQLLASSVDAVKDPVLNLMNINMTTVNAATTLVRLGFNLETAALLCSHPIIKELVSRNEQANIKGYEPFAVTLKNELDDIKKEIGDISVPADYNYTNNFLIKSRIVTGDTNTDSVNKFYILSLFDKLQNISNAFRIITHATRYNSITSAVGPMASDTILSKIQDSELLTSEYFNTPDESSEGNDTTLKDVLNDNPILKGFRESSYSLERNLLGRNLIEAGPVFERCAMNLYNIFGYATKSMLNKYSNFFTSYYTNMDNPVFNLSYDNRKYMIDEFPLTLMDERKKFPDNELLKNINLYQDDLNRTLTLSTRGLTDDQKQTIRAAWSDLYNNDPDYALKLVEYNFFIGSFGFNPRTFMALVPNDVKMALPHYIENSEKTRYLSEDEQERMNIQFMLNEKMPNLKQADPKARFEIPNDKFIIDSDNIKGNADYGVCVIKDSKGKDRWCVLEKDFDCSGKVFNVQKVDILGGYNQGFEINPNEDVPKTIYEETDKSEKARDDDSDKAVIEGNNTNSDFVNNKSNFYKMLDSILTDNEMYTYKYNSPAQKLSMIKDKLDKLEVKSATPDILPFMTNIEGVSQSAVDKIHEILSKLDIDNLTLTQADNILKNLNLCE